MKKGYESRSVGEALGHLVEECGEVLAAVGKAQRMGLDSYNPEALPQDRETNRAWILREIDDLEKAIVVAKRFLDGRVHWIGG